MTRKSRKLKVSKLFMEELTDQLLAQVQHRNADSILDESEWAGQINQQLAECMLAAELSHHLDTETGLEPGR